MSCVMTYSLSPTVASAIAAVEHEMTAGDSGELAMRSVVVRYPLGLGSDADCPALLDAAPSAEGYLIDLPDVVASAPPHPRMTTVAADFFSDRLPGAEASNEVLGRRMSDRIA